jgi:hypothetical protein
MCGLADVFHDEMDEKNGLIVNQLNSKNLRLVFIVTWEGTWRFPSNNLCFMAGAQGYPPPEAGKRRKKFTPPLCGCVELCLRYDPGGLRAASLFPSFASVKSSRLTAL